MQIASEMVALSGEEYRQYVEMRRHEREILRCLLVLDIPGIRKVWKEMAPHLDQPESDWDALRTMHEARIRMLRISPQQKRYSEHWLRELENKTRVAAAVGIAIKPFKAEYAQRAADMRHEMAEAVLLAVREGVNIEIRGARGASADGAGEDRKSTAMTDGDHPDRLDASRFSVTATLPIPALFHRPSLFRLMLKSSSLE